VLRAGGFDDDPRAALTHSMPDRLAVPEAHDVLLEGADVR
jgi:hypothetical protein